MTNKKLQLTPVTRLKQVINTESIQEQFQKALGENKDTFSASIIELVVSNQALQECDPNKLVAEALKAAVLKLPLTKSLGYAWVVPYKDRNGKKIPQFQIGYKGLIQLAMRSGIYKTINADVVYEGELSSRDKLSGIIELSGEKTSDKVIGYFAHFVTLNGFSKTVYISQQGIKDHAKKFSRAYQSGAQIWKDHFDAMAVKTVITQLFSKYALMSIEFAKQLQLVEDSERQDRVYAEDANAGEVIDVETGEVDNQESHTYTPDPNEETAEEEVFSPPPEDEPRRRSGPSF